MSTDSQKNIFAAAAVCCLLVLAVIVVFGQSVEYGFVNFDDDDYVTESRIKNGLNQDAVKWAFTTFHCSNWHPVTWLSHGLDCTVYGLNPWGHHLTNIVLHAAVVVLLFLILWQMTGDFWPSAFVAGVFAVHPLRAESVVWVAERKDLLCGLFFMLTLAAYLSYSRRPFSWWRYLLVMVAFAFGLMSKPMIVTMPFVLLLLDYWPLGRMKNGGWLRIFVEKLPLLAMSAGSAVATSLAQHKAISTLEILPIPARLANAVVSCVSYIGSMFFPSGLVVFYPYPEHSIPVWKIVSAALVLLGISAAALLWIRKRPFLFVGWFWYLGMLVPVIGLVQVGSQAMADRYTYLPQIGLCIAIAWGAMQIAPAWPYRRWVYGIASLAIFAMLMVCTCRQTAYWRDSEILWRRALDYAPGNVFAYNNLGLALTNAHRWDEATDVYKKALKIAPGAFPVHNNLGNVLASTGKIEEAAAEFREAVRLKSDYAFAHNNLGSILVKQGKIDEAIIAYNKALDADPEYLDVYNNLGTIFAERGELDKAIEYFQKTLQHNPRSLDAYGNLAIVFGLRGKTDKSVECWRMLIQYQPGNIRAVNQLAWIMATSEDASVRNGAEAIELARWAVQLTRNREPVPLSTLAAAYAEAGQFSDAVKTAEKAIELAVARKNDKLTESLRKQCRLYRDGVPYREPPMKFTPPSDSNNISTRNNEAPEKDALPTDGNNKNTGPKS
jgi:protein O-mannosyl-transferase